MLQVWVDPTEYREWLEDWQSAWVCNPLAAFLFSKDKEMEEVETKLEQDIPVVILSQGEWQETYSDAWYTSFKVMLALPGWTKPLVTKYRASDTAGYSCQVSQEEALADLAAALAIEKERHNG